MTAAHLTQWREARGLSKLAASKALGLAYHTYCGYEAGKQPIPLYVALACSALSFDLPPWASGAGR